MKTLVQEKEKATALRKKGLSYNEILRQVPVAKSSLSLWLKDLPLTKSEKDILKHRTNSNISKGRIRAAAANRQNRILKEKELLKQTKKQFGQFVTESLFHTGIALYWAEGAKRSSMFHFMNSDANVIRVVMLWIEKYTEYKISDLGFRLYIHEPYKFENWEKWWKKELAVSESQFKKTIIKPTQLGIKKRPDYKGCMRLEVPRSTELLIKMKFWTNMLVEYYKKE